MVGGPCPMPQPPTAPELPFHFLISGVHTQPLFQALPGHTATMVQPSSLSQLPVPWSVFALALLYEA